jgi:hypothetical protein
MKRPAVNGGEGGFYGLGKIGLAKSRFSRCVFLASAWRQKVRIVLGGYQNREKHG